MSQSSLDMGYNKFKVVFIVGGHLSLMLIVDLV
jgi:hypothetical protein